MCGLKAPRAIRRIKPKLKPKLKFGHWRSAAKRRKRGRCWNGPPMRLPRAHRAMPSPCAPTPSSWIAITIQPPVKRTPAWRRFWTPRALPPPSVPLSSGVWRAWTLPRATATPPTAIWPPSPLRAAPASLWRPAPANRAEAALYRNSRPPSLLRAHGRARAGHAIRRICCRPGAQRGHQRLSGRRGNEALEQTEYLKLVVRYLSQARELEKLAGAGKFIRIETCDSTETGDLLRVLGYRMRGGCGSDVVLETVNASRAFLTIDSGFPLAELEQALRTNRPFTLDYHPARIPRALQRRILAVRQGQDHGRVHRLFPVRSFAVPPVPGALQARSGNRGRAARGNSRAAPENLRARARLLRRHVRDPRRQGRRARRRALRESLGRPGRRVARQGRRVLRTAARPRRRLAGQLLRRAGAHQRSGARIISPIRSA